MAKKQILLFGAVLIASGAFAQKLQEGYITGPESSDLGTYIRQWNGGEGTIRINNAEWEDEEFYTSRVKPRRRFVNRLSQVRQEINDDNDKRYVNWVPIGYAAYNALPNGEFDQEVFSMWSYLDHYGDWTSPYGWVPGAMADAAHKNGVAVSGVASVPFGGISQTWLSCFMSLTSLDSQDIGKFFYYHGVDGVGYNSEWSGYSPSKLIALHDDLKSYMSSRNPLWEVIWYGGTTDSGSCSFDIGIGSSTALFRSASIFLNYNWNRESYYNSSVQYARSMGKSPFFIYAGMNQQGGEPHSGENYSLLKDWQYSIGVWGAHSVNMFWGSRNAGGATAEAMQRCYLNTCEQWYTNGPRNPAVRLPVKTVRDHRPKADWAGISSMLSARSALAWDILDEPFITYFNLGNGKFFNWEGRRVSDNEWYSLGIQDYLPTWRWWLTPGFMQGTVEQGGWNLAADFTWDDAYFGGSCLQVTGTTEQEYLHLFKTDFDIDWEQVITVRYKILEGEADVNLVLSPSDNPAEPVDGDFSILTSMLSARSALAWDILDEPFITYFNLGNGKFFNWEGRRVSDNEWYSLGIQDYLPTWRWWLTPGFMQGTVEQGGWNLAADFTWDDAYFGGSCLQVTGTTEQEYLHLFKTDFDIDWEQVITVRYKILEGEADVNLVLSPSDNPAEPVDGDFSILTVADSDSKIDASLREWQTAQFIVGEDFYPEDLQDNGGLGVIALEFKNARNMKLLLGELSIRPLTEAATPAKPDVTRSKTLAYTAKGVDGKLWWNMPGTKAAGEPVYNSDVNTSIFKVYSQEEGGEPYFVGATTSWAAIAFRSPVTDSDKRVRFGVSAVAVDFSSESEIAWGEYLGKPAYTQVSDVVLSKNPIKPDEPFTLGYEDKLHSPSTWKLVDVSGKTVFSGTGVDVEIAQGLPEVGGYDLVIDEGTANERTLGYFVQISPESVGALPELYTLSRGTEDVTAGGAPVEIELTDTPVLSYTGRPADGQASRALALNSVYIGAKVEDLDIQAQKSFSVAGWTKINEIPTQQWNLFNVSNKLGTWPQNTWGWVWMPGEADGTLKVVFRGSLSGGQPGELHYVFPDLKMQAGLWMHLAFVFDYTSEGFRFQLYVNGVKQKSRVLQFVSGNDGAARTTPGGLVLDYDVVDGRKIGRTDGDTYIDGQTFAIQADDYLYFGGAAHEGASIDGLVDDFMVWGKAMTAEDVRESMSGYTGNTLNPAIKALWDFESEANDDNSFSATGSKAGAKGYNYEVLGNPDGGTTYYNYLKPVFLPGCSFLRGTGYPIVTRPVWSDTNRKTSFEKVGSRAATEGEAGSAKVTFVTEGDHTVQLTLKNPYGESTMTYPVFKVGKSSAIEGVEADQADVDAYTVDDILFIEFAADGNYDVQVYNTAGMLCGAETLAAVAGQNARITLGRKGVYLVRVARDGQPLRTLKVISK